MAVTRFGGGLMIGLSTDTKPGSHPGALFYETDTGDKFEYTGTSWARVTGGGRLLVEERYTYSMVASDTQIKAGAGFLHSLTFTCNDAAPTAGSIIVYDSLTEANTQIYNETFTTTPFRGYSVILDVAFSTGLYVGFTTTNDVNVTVSYR